MPQLTRDPEALEALAELHDDVERRASALAASHGARMRCGAGCASCCVDELSVFSVEAERIRRAAGELLESGQPHPVGACALLDAQGRCRVYAVRPYVCRTQGLPLRWIVEGPDAVEEHRDICPLNDEQGPPVETLEPEACWTLGPDEGRLAALEGRFTAGRPERVALRDLFGSAGDSRPDPREREVSSRPSRR
jgi:Fe-S-cluster containining protein